mgnify:CR=1 FL=1
MRVVQIEPGPMPTFTASAPASAKAKAAADAKAALEALKAGKSIDDVAASAKLAVQAPGLSTRDRSGLGLALLESVFKLPRPAALTPSFGSATLEGGATAVIALKTVVDGALKAGAEPAGEMASIREARAGAEFNAYREALKKRIKVEVKELPAEEPVGP